MSRPDTAKTGKDGEAQRVLDLHRFDPKHVVLFDGVCNLCNSSVNFLIDRDLDGTFLFASLQSGFGQQVLASEHLDKDDLKSIILISGGRVYTRSSAILRIARRMRAGWPLLFALISVPRVIRDGLYDFVARRRYRWFGKRASCRVPTPELRSRFLD